MIVKKKMFVCLQCFVLACLMSVCVSAQSMIPVQGKAPNFYITYKVQPKETLSAIGRNFGASVGDIMRLNGMHSNSKLMVGEEIKIPLNAKNMQRDNSGNAMPLVHVVQKGETLYRISINHNKVPVDLLKQWNNLGERPIEIGENIIVGYLKTSGQVNMPAVTQAPAAASTHETPKPEVKEVQPATPSPAPVVKETVPAAKPATDNTTATVTPLVKTSEAPAQKPVDLSNISEEGFFAPLFGRDVEGRDLRSANGVSATFKTASGWTDRKYYILMNDIPPGSIVKVTYNDKVIYAKVLWSLGEMKENEGLAYRISNSAAAALGISDAKFNIVVVYYE